MKQSIWQLFEERVTQFSDSTAWRRRLPSHGHFDITYGAIGANAKVLAAQLKEKGVEAGDVIAVMAPNGPEFVAGVMACWRLGGVLAPVHHANSPADIETQLEAVKPKVLLAWHCDADFDPVININLDPDLKWSDEDDLPEVEYDAETVSTVIYTSGSTGNPSVVRLSHRNHLSQLDDARKVLDLSENDVFLSLLPLSHAMELTAGMMLAIDNGAKTVVPRVIAANEIISALSEEDITVMIAVPRLFRNIMNGLRNRFAQSSMPMRAFIGVIRSAPNGIKKVVNKPLVKKFGRPRYWVSGGSRLDPEICDYFRKLGFPLIQGYGLTETSPVISAQWDFGKELDDVGLPLPSQEVKISEPDNNGVGELWVKGPNVMMGYTDPKKTETIMEGEWLKTGDLAKISKTGRISLVGRIKRLIVTEAGKNVYPDDLEVRLERYDGVKEAAVIEVDHAPAAIFAVDDMADTARCHEVLKEFNQEASSHNRINRFAVVDELPRTPLGKIALGSLPQVFSEAEVSKETKSRKKASKKSAD